jgi:hypothetical protein
LDDIGWADLFAESIDDHSVDNCEIDRFEVKRITNTCGMAEDLEFGPKVNFCCEDTSNDPDFYVKVIMRVYDVSGNYNDCLVNVKVQDKMKPTIQCPGNVTLDCDQDYKNLSLTGGSATGQDNCDLTITFTDSGSLNACGQGTIFRTWKATDNGGSSATCTQRIEIRDSNPFNETNITWPADREVNGCAVADAHPDLINSYPTYTNDNCADIALSYDDLVVNNFPGVCIKILRTWKVADWCNFNPQSSDYFTYVQKIEVKNTSKPVITSSCQNVEIETPGVSCEANVNLIVTATDDCTSSSALKYRWEIDLKNNGTVDQTGNSNQVNGTYASGTHKVSFTVTDACGNSTQCSYLFKVRDNKPPTPICLGEVVWVLDEDGNAEVWASDFNLKSEDTCDSESELSYAFNEAGNQTALSFDCSDIENGVSQEIPLQMYVFDTDGNFEFCNVLLILQDSEGTNACDDVSDSGRIAGNVVTEKNELIDEVMVTLTDMNSEETRQNMTNDAGRYEFDNLNFYQPYEVSPLLDVNPLNGVSTLDLVLIQRHILGLDIMTSPYKLLASDINKSKTISASDLVELRKLILGLSPKFAQSASWMFVPRTWEFIDFANPFDVDNKYYIEQLLSDKMDMDFVGIKMGDVNESAIVNLNKKQDDQSRNGKVKLYVENTILRSNEPTFIPVYANFDKDIYGLQFNMNVNSNIEILSLKSGVIRIEESNFSIAESNNVNVSIDTPYGANISTGEVLFYVEINATSSDDLSSMVISSDFISAEVYTTSLEVFALNLDINNVGNNDEEAVYTNTLFQNVPNPFSDITTVSFNAENDGKIELSVMDISGKVIYQTNNNYSKGQHQVVITKDQLNGIAGVYYIQMKSNHVTSTKKMIMIE